jgi:hypothetical protein
MLECKDHWQNADFWWSFEFDIRMTYPRLPASECQIHSTS